MKPNEGPPPPWALELLATNKTNGGKIPTWAQNLLSVGAIIVALTVFTMTLKSDIKSNSQAMSTLTVDLASLRTDLKEVRGLLPNREATDMQLAANAREIERVRLECTRSVDAVEKKIDEIQKNLKLERIQAQEFREMLLSKGVIQK